MPHLPDTGQIVLTLVAKGGTNPTAPTLWEKTVAQCGTSGHSIHRRPRRNTSPLIYSRVYPAYEDVWATMEQFAQPVAEGFLAPTGEGTELYDAVCPLPKRLLHR